MTEKEKKELYSLILGMMRGMFLAKHGDTRMFGSWHTTYENVKTTLINDRRAQFILDLNNYSSVNNISEDYTLYIAESLIDSFGENEKAKNYFTQLVKDSIDKYNQRVNEAQARYKEEKERGFDGEPRYTCPCCGYKTLHEEGIGTYEICHVCFWEHDRLQYNDPFLTGSANRESLYEAQQNFIKTGPKDEGFIRKPFEWEIKDPNWKPVELP